MSSSIFSTLTRIEPLSPMPLAALTSDLDFSVGEPAARDGALIAYGPDYVDLYRRAASYVERILKGTKPADLPVEQPTKFELVINLKTAQTLRHDLPLSLQIRVDEVLE